MTDYEKLSPLGVPVGMSAAASILFDAPQTPSGAVFAMLPSRAGGPRPTLLLFSATGLDALSTEPYCHVGRVLQAQGWNVVSLDLPYRFRHSAARFDLARGSPGRPECAAARRPLASSAHLPGAGTEGVHGRRPGDRAYRNLCGRSDHAGPGCDGMEPCLMQNEIDSQLVLRLDAAPDNPRNSEGSFVTLADGRILFAYTRYGRPSWRRSRTEVLTQPRNLAELTRLSGIWIEELRERQPMRELILDMDSSVSETYGEQEGTAYNGHFDCTCYHPLFCFNQFGDVERAQLREGNVHSAKDWRAVLEPVVARYRRQKIPCYFRADAAFANPEVYEFLEVEGYGYAIRLPANDVLQREIAPLLTRPVGRPSNAPVVRYADFLYQAQSWKCARRVVAKVEWHKGELFPRVGFIVNNLTRSVKQVVRFYNQRGTAEQCIKEGKNAVNWTRLSCHDFADNQARLQLFVLAYNLGNFLRQAVLPRAVRHWTLTTLKEKLIKIGAKVVRHARQVIFQMAEVAIPRELFRAILERIGRLRLPTPQTS